MMVTCNFSWALLSTAVLLAAPHVSMVTDNAIDLPPPRAK